METTATETKATSVTYDIDLNRDGHLEIKNARTIQRYKEIKEEMSRAPLEKFDCFFAFGNQQFAEGLKSIRPLAEGEKIYHAGAGLYGTKDGLDKLDEWYKEKENQIGRECDPFEIYLYECNNHEACYGGDTEPVKLILRYFGEETAKRIYRIKMYIEYPIDEIIEALKTGKRI